MGEDGVVIFESLEFSNPLWHEFQCLPRKKIVQLQNYVA